METVKSLKVKRAGLRTSFTSTANALKLELEKEVVAADILSDKFTKLQNVNLEIKGLDDKILDFLCSDDKVDEADITKEIEGREVYSDDFIVLSRVINEKLNVSDDPVLESRSSHSNKTSNLSNNVNNMKKYKLPKIELKKFDGELINWLPFWAQFEKIHKDPDLFECDKFSYLIQCMKSGSRAKEFLDSYPVTTENYEKAVLGLKERFANPELLIEVYVRELIKLIINNVRANNRDKLPLEKLYDKIEAQLRALESLGLESSENSAWLFPMVESCLSEEVLRAWQRSAFFSIPREDGKHLSRLINLMKFLKGEVEGEERLKLARSGFDIAGNPREAVRGELRDKNPRIKRQANVPTTSGFLTTRDASCIFCGKTHDSKNCFNTRSLSLNDRIAKIRANKFCFKCLEPNHMAKFCKKFVKCISCGRAHHIMVCPELNVKIETVDKPVLENSHTATARQSCTSEVALMTLWVRVAGVDGYKDVRALLDCGSQKSYILESLAAELRLPVVSKENVSLTLFGGSRMEPKLHNRYRVKLCSASPLKSPNLEYEFLDQKVICGDIPRVSKGPIFRELKTNNIWLSDVGEGSPKIQMLIGCDIYGKIITGKIKQLKGGLTAIETKLGWVVCGTSEVVNKGEATSLGESLVNLATHKFNISDLWSLETIGIKDVSKNLSKAAEEEFAREQFLNSLSRNEEGRYCVGLPWLGNNERLPSNRHIAEKRLFNVTSRLKYLNNYEAYDTIFKEWLEEGVIEVAPNDVENSEGHYLPHHPVFKPNSITTKVRPVFDASCKDRRSPSLNDCLVTGPNLIEEIPSILLRFREKCIGVSSDIRRAFLQIELRKEDRDFLKFLWWEKNNEIKVFRHTRVVFGVKSSPYLLGAVISAHLSQVSEEQRPIAKRLEKSFYIDNSVISLDNEKELQEFVKTSVQILAEAKMDLRSWEFGPLNEVAEDYLEKFREENLETSVNVLGLKWDKVDDTLAILINAEELSEILTKREILSVTQSIFDPLGFLSPVLLPAKLLIREAWALKSDWDAPLTEEIVRKFQKWLKEIGGLDKLKIPRRMGFGNKENWSLHIFCDASQNAYATVIFLRCESNDNISVSFVMAKVRVSPLKGMTIPRLELMACVLGGRLSKYVIESLDLEGVPKHFWSDSTTALSWIKRNNSWGTFVGNRVKEICSITEANRWSFVPSHLNPADLPSRGCSPHKFPETNWWNGPVWLKGPNDSWPKSEIKPDECLVESELRKGKDIKVNLTVSGKISKDKWYERISKFSKMIRVLSWVKRFVNKCQKKVVNPEPFLSSSELEESKLTLLSLVQSESFLETGDSVQGLLTVRDQSGLLRVKTKIIERDDEYAFRYPILLPSKHYIVSCLIREHHFKHSHAGIQALSAILREEYWIIGARRAIRSIVNKCVRCKRFSAKPLSTAPIHLPLDRVKNASAFEVTGIDLCGPLILKSKSKSWVVLFTCAVYRCVHLELVTSMSTESFLQALRRFIARRGRPAVVYSDNGTNFVGASALLKKVDWGKVISQESLTPITWKFIPPTAAWWGGWWERLVRTTKNLLLRVLGKSSVSYEELLTILCDVEAVINSRPLTYISNDFENLEPLTPSMFLQDIRVSSTGDLDVMDRNKLLVRQRFCQELREQFRSRFRKEYLSQLVQRHGQKDCNLKVGDMVLVGSENTKRVNWPIARVHELCTGRDGRVRVVVVKTNNGFLTRPVRRLYPLEISQCSQDTIM